MTWRCEHCEAVYETNDPPCDSCGNESLEPTANASTVDSVSTFVWACEKCGREHVKNSPPCSRCGHPMLERREPTYDDPEPEPAGYLEVARPYLPAVALFAVVIGLTATGVVTVDMLPGHGPPSPPDAPGNGSREAGIDLEAVADDVFERLEAERVDRNAESRTHDDGLRALATFRNRERVIDRYGGDDPGAVEPTDFDPTCSGTTIVSYPVTFVDEVSIDAHRNESDLSATIVQRLLSEAEVQPSLERALFSSYASDGIDVHVGPDGAVYVYYAAC